MQKSRTHNPKDIAKHVLKGIGLTIKGLVPVMVIYALFLLALALLVTILRVAIRGL
ncbi:MAG: hypothetical protein LBL67_05455 [Coriobacteriales bacterium]|jgi:hypothetical protein|nr:hypothetical protein [Coriobacteriales bacterium]